MKKKRITAKERKERNQRIVERCVLSRAQKKVLTYYLELDINQRDKRWVEGLSALSFGLHLRQAFEKFKEAKRSGTGE